MQSEVASDFVNRKELARLLGVSSQTIYRWVRVGILPQPTHGKLWKLSEVVEFFSAK